MECWFSEEIFHKFGATIGYWLFSIHELDLTRKQLQFGAALEMNRMKLSTRSRNAENTFVNLIEINEWNNP